jgi:hypothetical protein
MERPEDLKELAAWYRRMAEVGHSDEANSRGRLADYLERRAIELEEHDNCPRD